MKRTRKFIIAALFLTACSAPATQQGGNAVFTRDSRLAEPLRLAVEFWNEQCPTFYVSEGEGIEVKFADLFIDGKQFFGQFDKQANLIRIDLELQGDGFIDFTGQVVAHELGHFLGLEHSAEGLMRQESGGGWLLLPDEYSRVCE